jgi:uncharacterized protein
MANAPLIISLPIADRQTSFTFYRAALGLEPIGELAEDGVPEPLQFELTGGVHLMLVPTGGFGWVIGDHAVAASGTSECVLGIAVSNDRDVDALIERAAKAGATVVVDPGQQPWGYVGTFADPDGHLWMVTSASAPS